MSDIVEIQSTGESKDNDDVTVDGTVGGVILLAANRARKSALIINTGANPMRVTTDGSVPTETHGKLVAAGAALTLSSPYCPYDVVKACPTTAGNTTANASEVD